MNAESFVSFLTIKRLLKFVVTALLVVLGSPLVLLLFGCWMFFRVLALLLVWVYWSPRGITMLIIYSNSPHWRGYFEDGLIPLIAGRTKVLNWSDRSNWSISLPRIAFTAFREEKGFNPMIIYFRPFHWPKVLSFYQPFRDAKHGKMKLLFQAESSLSNWLNRPINLEHFHPRSSA